MPTILVADDEQLIRWSLSERLQADGLRIVEAATGREAVGVVQRESIDLVLLDYKLPDIDGVAVLRQIKEHDPDIVVILLTAYATVDTAVEAMKTGAYHVANKPFNVDAVSDLVAKALEKLTLTGHRPIVLVSPQIRPGLRLMTESHLPRLVVRSSTTHPSRMAAAEELP